MKGWVFFFLVSFSFLVEGEEADKVKKLADGAMEGLYREEQALLGRLYRASLKERLEIRKELEVHQKRVRLQEKLLGLEAPQRTQVVPSEKREVMAGSSWLPETRETTAMTWSDEHPEPMAWWPDSWKIRLPGPPPEKKSKRRRVKPILENSEVEEEHFESPLERPEVREKKREMLDLLSLHPRQVLGTRQIIFGVPKSFRSRVWYLWEKKNQGDWVYLTEGKSDRNFKFDFQEDLSLRYIFTKRRHQPNRRDPGMYYFILDTQRPEVLDLSRKVGEYGLTQLNWHFDDINAGTHPVTFRLLNAEGGVVAMEGALPSKGRHIMSTQQAKESVRGEWTVRDEAGNLTQKVLDLK